MAPFKVMGVTQRRSMEIIDEITAIMYHFLRLSVRSVKGPAAKRQRLAETPNATIPAVCATEKPEWVKRYGNVTVAKPKLIPQGRTRKRILTGLVKRFFCKRKA